MSIHGKINFYQINLGDILLLLLQTWTFFDCEFYRVLDLVDIYLENDPSLSLVLDTIPNLFTLLEFCVKSPHQRPLENRIRYNWNELLRFCFFFIIFYLLILNFFFLIIFIRSTLKKIGNIKKCSNCEDIDVQLVADVLKKLMDKGVRSMCIDISIFYLWNNLNFLVIGIQ